MPRHVIEIQLEQLVGQIVQMRATCRKTRGRMHRTPFWTLMQCQALVTAALTQYSTKRWIKYKIAYVMEQMPGDWLQLYDREQVAGVYYLCNTNTKMDYVGESKNMRTRFFSEMGEAKKLRGLRTYNDHPKYQQNITAKKTKQPYSIRVIERHGIDCWMMLPVMHIPGHEVDVRTTRKRMEKHLIQSLNPKMNTKHTNWHKQTNPIKTQTRSRPPIRVRKKLRT